MSISRSVVVSTPPLINQVRATVETARDIIKDSPDSKLKAVASVLCSAVIDLKRRLMDQDDEIRRLKEKLADNNLIVGPKGPQGYFYRKDDSVNPLCPRCVQQPSPIHTCMGPALPKSTGLVRTCPICDFEVREMLQDFGRAVAISIAIAIAS